MILGLGRWLLHAPGVLIAVVLSIVAAVAFDLAGRGVDLVGELPQGLPPFTIPCVGLDDLGLLFAGAFGIAGVAGWTPSRPRRPSWPAAATRSTGSRR